MPDPARQRPGRPPEALPLRVDLATRVTLDGRAVAPCPVPGCARQGAPGWLLTTHTERHRHGLGAVPADIEWEVTHRGTVAVVRSRSGAFAAFGDPQGPSDVRQSDAERPFPGSGAPLRAVAPPGVQRTYPPPLRPAERLHFAPPPLERPRGDHPVSRAGKAGRRRAFPPSADRPGRDTAFAAVHEAVPAGTETLQEWLAALWD